MGEPWRGVLRRRRGGDRARHRRLELELHVDRVGPERRRDHVVVAGLGPGRRPGAVAVGALAVPGHRRPSTGWSLRTTTDCFGTAAAQSWVDQIRSLPEVTLTTSGARTRPRCRPATTSVVSVSVNTTGWPAYAGPSTDGVATDVAVGAGARRDGQRGRRRRGRRRRSAGPCRCPARGVRRRGGGGSWPVAAGVPCSRRRRPTARASGPPEPPLPSRRAIPKTRANATATSSSRRVQ